MNKWSLTGVSDELTQLVIPVSDDLSIGRNPDNHVVLSGQNISRQHALISVQNGNLFIKDLGSSNGTSVNDKALEPNKSKHISHNDIISFADLAFKVIDNEQLNEQQIETNLSNQPATAPSTNTPTKETLTTNHQTTSEIADHTANDNSPSITQEPVKTHEPNTTTDPSHSLNNNLDNSLKNQGFKHSIIWIIVIVIIIGMAIWLFNLN